MALNQTVINFLATLPQGCYPNLVPGVDTSYGYRPHLAAGIVFVTLFAGSLIGHGVKFTFSRQWSSLLFALGALTETLGWAARTWSAKCPYNHDAFLMQITTLIIAPTFFAAAFYVLLGGLIKQLGPNSSLLSPYTYALVFCTCDIMSLVIQAVGGGLASSASNKVNGNTKPGTNVMVGGIAFQLGTMSIFALLVADFIRRGRKRDLTSNQKLLIFTLIVSFIMVYIRSIYRTVELAQGWKGYTITHEGFFLGLDAALMVIAVCSFNILDAFYFITKDSPVSSVSKTSS